MISLFAFIMALGIVVDDAIIVGENIYEHRQMDKPYLQAAIDGAIEVYRPVTFSVLTTVVAFTPLIFVSGLMGKFIKTIPLVVISIFLVSLVESLFILPAHLGFGKPLTNPRGLVKNFLEVHKKFGAALERFIQGPYKRLLHFCICNRYVTLASAVVVLLFCVGLVGGGFVKFRFMPAVEGDVILVELEMPVGTPARKTLEVHDLITREAYEVFAAYDRELGEKNSLLRNIYGVVGGTLAEGGPMGQEGTTGANLANIAVFLRPSEERDVSSGEIAQRWRERVGELAGVESLTFVSNLIRLGANIDVQLAHVDFEVLEKASRRLKQALKEYPAVGNIADNYARGKKELKITLKPEARTLNVTEEDLGRQVRAAFFGSEALRLQRGRNEVKVMVRYPEEERRSLWSLDQMRIRTPEGGELPLDRAAHVQEGEGFSEINRTDRKRVVNVTADVDSARGNTEEILADLRENTLKKLLQDFPGLTYDMGGEQKEQKDAIGSMRDGFILALFCVYALLAIPFRSYSQPVLIMAAIPFGIVGATFGHLIMGFDLSILSMFGIVALSGVVVNDSLLLIDRINSRLREGEDPMESVLEAGTRRFRPILLTSLTTFFGLMPMILETSTQAQFLIPMAISLGFGILFATGITLIFLPSLYLILEDVRGLFGLRTGHADHTIDSGCQ
jgi:multidrug efflux pump subunit AcrB